MTAITSLRVVDVRCPTSKHLDGSDAMNPDPDYSAAYVILGTDAPGKEGRHDARGTTHFESPFPGETGGEKPERKARQDPVEVARDPSPLDRWSIVRLDWDFPPFLRPIEDLRRHRRHR